MRSTPRASMCSAAAIAAAVMAPMAAAAANVCIKGGQIDHTRVIDPRTILFYLRDGQVLLNRLDGDCYSLKFATEGVTYLTHGDDEISGNQQSFRVRDTGQICNLGPFTPYLPQAGAPAR